MDSDPGILLDQLVDPIKIVPGEKSEEFHVLKSFLESRRLLLELGLPFLEEI